MASGDVVGENPRPGSIRRCRPWRARSAVVVLGALLMPIPALLPASAAAEHVAARASAAAPTPAPPLATPPLGTPPVQVTPAAAALLDDDVDRTLTADDADLVNEPRVMRVHVGGDGEEVALDSDVTPVVFAGAAGQTVTVTVTAPEVDNGCLRAAVHEWTPYHGVGAQVAAPVCLEDGRLPELELDDLALFAVVLEVDGDVATAATATVRVEDDADVPVVTPDTLEPMRFDIPARSKLAIDFPIPEDRWAAAWTGRFTKR